MYIGQQSVPGSSLKAKQPKSVRAKKALGRPRRGQSKAKILEIATKMFADEGYSAVSIRDIATACKLSIPSIYHFFGDKEALFASCCAAIFAKAAQRLHASLVSARGPKATVKQFTIALSEILLDDADFRRLLQREILRDERRQFEDLTTHFFVEEFSLLVKEIAELENLDLQAAREHAFSIYALTFGLIQLRRTAEVAGIDKSTKLNASHLAERVLGIVLPHIKWHG
jgi:AcrR family transcriptional regulator